MRRWTRATAETICGGVCGHRIARGEPLLIITLVGVTRPRVRCRQCAGEPVPADLAPLPIVSTSAPAGGDFMTRVGALARQRELVLASREPGEEG